MTGPRARCACAARCRSPPTTPHPVQTGDFDLGPAASPVPSLPGFPHSAQQLAQRIATEMHKAVVGQDELVEMLVIAAALLPAPTRTAGAMKERGARETSSREGAGARLEPTPSTG